MNKPNVSKFAKSLRTTITKRSPEILTGIGIAGMLTTTVLAVRATPKALELLNTAEDSKFDNGHGEPLTKIEVIKVAWKPYIPAIITGVLSTICIVSASSVNLRRNAAIATAYQISQTALTEYKEKVVETIGEKREQTVKDKIAKKNIDENPVSKNSVIITNKGNTLCYDITIGRYFKSDIEKIKKAVNEVNRRLVYDQYISLNDFYSELGLEHTELGDELGWNLDDGLLELDFSSQLADDGTPCVVISYVVAPKYDYSKFA